MGAMWERNFLIRSMILGKSTWTSTSIGSTPDFERNDIPNSLFGVAAFLASRIILAHRNNALEGTHPALRQSPPASSPLIMQLLAPRRAACADEKKPTLQHHSRSQPNHKLPTASDYHTFDDELHSIIQHCTNRVAISRVTRRATSPRVWHPARVAILRWRPSIRS
mmetsp:Transcript_37730/g.79564  ORF Transcript_37730/g.79564 Transcript_37730/m.79564 type:complete len:166 (-) Transcript_37730:120-617(-)